MIMKIPIKGVIVANEDKWIYQLFGYEVTTPDDVNKLIDKANGEKLEVIINSPGGDVYSASEIYTSIMDYKGSATTKIVGVAASAAGVIAMAGTPAKISPTAQLMLHNVSETARGDYRVFGHESEVLKNYNKSIANAYLLKTGMKMDELLELMDTGGTANTGAWLTAQQAKELGFVDEIMFDTGNRLAASATSNLLLPQSVIQNMREMLASKENDEKLMIFKESLKNIDLPKGFGGLVNLGNDSEGDNDKEEMEKQIKFCKAKLNLLKLRRVN